MPALQEFSLFRPNSVDFAPRRTYHITLWKIGFTTTIPVEVVLAAGFRPVDLNNIFIGDADLSRMVGGGGRGPPRTTAAG
jgi:hypothetical protein